MSAPSPPPSAPPSAGPAADSVDRLVVELSASPLWTNGTFPRIDLPATTPIADVVDQVFRSVSFDRGPVRSHRILGVRTVTIGDEAAPYTAVTVDTDLGHKIVLLRYDSRAIGWWSRVFDAK